MPRHDWFDDDTMSRDRRERGYGEHDRHDRGFRDEDHRDRSAMFGRGREDFDRGDRQRRGQKIGGWGGLMGDESSGSRNRDRDRDRDSGMRSRQDEQQYGSDDYNRGIPMDETERLIASNKVEGTPVYDRHGDKLGTVHNFMVDKRKGQVVYAVLKHGGGFLGLGERYYPLEWDQLTYDTRLGGYAVDLMEEDLESFGSFDSQGQWRSRSSSGRSGREMGRNRERDRDYRSQRSMHEPW